MNSSKEAQLVARVVKKLRSFTTVQMLRMSAAQYFGIPMNLSDEDALRVFRKALAEVEGVL